MKSLIIKISLFATVIAVVILCVYFFIKPTPKVDELRYSTNPVIQRIVADIDSILPLQSDFVKARAFYEAVQAHIDENCDKGRLCNTFKDMASNETNKIALSELLYAGYFNTFDVRVFKIFQQSNWKSADLSFISNEIKELQSSPHYDGKDFQGTETKKMRDILNTYYNITNFVAACKSYTYPYDGVGDEFSIETVKKKMKDRNDYRTNSFYSNYVKNCENLRNDLADVPKILFYRHTNYLSQKINKRGKEYDLDYLNTSQKYKDNFIAKLKTQIVSLYNVYESVYNVNFDIYKKERTRLDIELDSIVRKADIHFNEQNSSNNHF